MTIRWISRKRVSPLTRTHILSKYSLTVLPSSLMLSFEETLFLHEDENKTQARFRTPALQMEPHQRVPARAMSTMGRRVTKMERYSTIIIIIVLMLMLVKLLSFQRGGGVVSSDYNQLRFEAQWHCQRRLKTSVVCSDPVPRPRWGHCHPWQLWQAYGGSTYPQVNNQRIKNIFHQIISHSQQHPSTEACPKCETGEKSNIRTGD